MPINTYNKIQKSKTSSCDGKTLPSQKAAIRFYKLDRNGEVWCICPAGERSKGGGGESAIGFGPWKRCEQVRERVGWKQRIWEQVWVFAMKELNMIQRRIEWRLMGRQWRCCRTGEWWLVEGVLVMTWAAGFLTSWSLWMAHVNHRCTDGVWTRWL